MSNSSFWLYPARVNTLARTIVSGSKLDGISVKLVARQAFDLDFACFTENRNPGDNR